MSKKQVVKSGSEREVSGSCFACRLIRHGIAKGSALAPLLFNVFVNSLDEATLVEFSGNVKLKGSVDNHLHSRTVILRDLDRWKE